MNNIAGALYRVIKIKNEKRNEMKCSRRMRSVSRLKRPNTLTGRNVRLSNLLTSSRIFCVYVLYSEFMANKYDDNDDDEDDVTIMIPLSFILS